MPLTKLDVEHIAKLARLHLTQNELDKLSLELPLIVQYFEQLQDVNTDSVDLADQFTESCESLREDRVIGSLPREKALANAPDTDGEYFKVPKVIG